MINFLTIAAFFFASHLLSYAATGTDFNDPLINGAQLYMNLMEDVGQLEDIQTNEKFRAGIFNLFSENFIKIVNGEDVLAPYQNSESGDSDVRESLIERLTAARVMYGRWTFPNDFISLKEIPGEYKIELHARAVIQNDGSQLSILKILTFDKDDKISRLDEVFLKIR